MSLWAIVPVKPLNHAKSRLAQVLSPGEREGMNREFLIRALEVLQHVPPVVRTLVVSRDPAALAIAREHGARTLLEEGAPQLNLALTRATIVAGAYGAAGVLILPTDLPLLSVDDLNTLIAACANDRGMAIAPDRREQGTNALLVRPPGLVQYAFGPDSFAEHLRRGEATGACVNICRLPGIALDIDLPADLELYRARNGNGNGKLEPGLRLPAAG
ncbi:MAG: 2-phospho-L-lactate guanylyltransferase [Chloroflexi bacterium]|nr:2-phospho-L-lactate guanylyltransferase [Chloroflexota bacterium]